MEDLRNKFDVNAPRCRFPIEVLQRFWSKVEVVASGCWMWRGNYRRDGYGKQTVRPHCYAAHRMSWEIRNGPIPAGKCVLHRCDVKGCVNPDHLFLGTKQENTDDMIRKGRLRSGNHAGERNGRAKVTEGMVREIRKRHREGLPSSALAAAFGVGVLAIQRILNGTRWKEVK